MDYPDSCVLLFARVPRAGEVKTRLIPALGAEGACRVHERLLRRTLDMLKEQRLCHVELWKDSTLPHECFAALDWPVRVQEGKHLGERMEHAMHESLAKYGKLVFMGTDCPALDRDYLQRALELLAAGHEVVLGPAHDGGYVLLGLGRAMPALFRDIDWGSARVLQQTLQRLPPSMPRPCLLPPLRDIDRPEDLESIFPHYLQKVMNDI